LKERWRYESSYCSDHTIARVPSLGGASCDGIRSSSINRRRHHHQQQQQQASSSGGGGGCGASSIKHPHINSSACLTTPPPPLIQNLFKLDLRTDSSSHRGAQGSQRSALMQRQEKLELKKCSYVLEMSVHVGSVAACGWLPKEVLRGEALGLKRTNNTFKYTGKQ
jgi:hypothetical protein